MKKFILIGSLVTGLALGGYSDEVKDAAAIGNAFSKVAEEVIPSVVVITGLRAPTQSNYQQVSPELRRFFGLPEYRRQPQHSSPQPMGKGSGVIVRKNGYVLTNYHVIKDMDYLEVRLNDGTIYNNHKDPNAVKIVGTDQDTDLAVLKIGNGKLTNLKPAKFADSSKIRVGEWAIAVGAPFNLDYSVTVGVVSQKGRYNVNINKYDDYIQTDASINPGNSGGPLLNIRSEIIGINDFIYTGGGSKGSIGLGFAISSNLVKRVTDSLITSGKVVRPWLGVIMQDLTPEMKKSLDVDKGVFVREVVKGSPAERAGIKPGDTIQQIADKAIKVSHDIQSAVLAQKPGDTVTVTVNRDSTLKKIEVILKPMDEVVGGSGGILNEIGLVVKGDNGGVSITQVIPDTSADNAGLKEGMKIIKVNRRRIKNTAQFVKMLKANRQRAVLILIEFHNRIYYTNLRLK